MNSKKDVCFCTIAAGKPYREMTRDLALDLQKYASGTSFYVYTDVPDDFRDLENVVAFKYHQKGIQSCFNDRRLVVQQVLLDFPVAIHIDADTKIVDDLSDNLDFPIGITGCFQDLQKHMKKHRPREFNIVETVAKKLEIPLEECNWIGESLYVVTRDGGKEKEFIEYWGLIANYVELNKMHGGDGNLMGLAAAKVGWKVNMTENLQKMRLKSIHTDASHSVKRSSWEQFQRRVAYHYRLNKARLFALKDFDFYYR